MTRRRLLLFGLPAIAVAMAVGVWLRPSETAINVGNAAKLRDGMKLLEAEAILGGPARDEWNGPLLADLCGYAVSNASDKTLFEKRVADNCRNAPRKATGFRDWQSGAFRKYGETHVWTSSSLVILVDFDGDGRIAWLKSQRVRPGPESLPARIRRWLHLSATRR